MSLRILMADDHEVVRHGLRALLESSPGWQVAAEVDTGSEAVEKTTELKPDLVVLDITMPGLGGLEAARRIRQVAPQTEVLFLTVHDSEQMVREALEAGARGYVLKSDAGRDLLAAVEAVRRHKFFFSPKIVRTLGSRPPDPGAIVQKGSTTILTPREREVLKLLAEGRSTKEAAAFLRIATKTAETHRTNIMRKLDLHSISDLVRYAIRNGMVEA